MPKLLLAASVPAIDWNTRSTGAPLPIRSSVVVTCASTQLCVGMSSLVRISSSIDEQRVRIVRAVGRRIDPDHGIAGAEKQPVENARRDAARIVGRVIGLEPHRQAARQAQRVAERRHHAAFRRHDDQILQAADLAHGRRHFRRDAGRERGQDRRRRFIRQQPVAKAADGQMRNRRKRRAVVGIDDEPRDFVGLIGNNCFVEERGKRQVGERILRGDAFLAGRRRNARELVAAAQRRRLGQQGLEIGEDIAACSDRGAVHCKTLRTASQL